MRKERQVFGAICQPHVVAQLQRVDRAGQFGVAAALMMTKGLAVGRNHHESAGLGLRRRLSDRIREPEAVREAVVERNRARKIAVETKDR